MPNFEDRRRVAEAQRKHNSLSLRWSRVSNGYLLTDLGSGEGMIATTRAEAHELTDVFFDRIELEQRDKQPRRQLVPAEAC